MVRNFVAAEVSAGLCGLQVYANRNGDAVQTGE